MPAERRSLRSNNKSDTSSSANGEKANSNSQSPGAKDKAPTTRAAANKAKSAPTKKDAKGASNGNMGDDDKSHTNGSKSTENGVNGSEDVEMGDTAGAPTSSSSTSKDRKSNEKMTVVVPPTKGSKSSGKDKEDDVTMEGAEDVETTEPEVDPTTKAIQGSSSFPCCSKKSKCLTICLFVRHAFRHQIQLYPSRASRCPFRPQIYPPCSAIDIVDAETPHPGGPRRSHCGNLFRF